MDQNNQSRLEHAIYLIKFTGTKSNSSKDKEGSSEIIVVNVLPHFHNLGFEKSMK